MMMWVRRRRRMGSLLQEWAWEEGLSLRLVESVSQAMAGKGPSSKWMSIWDPF
jgi:hypothetical protein